MSDVFPFLKICTAVNMLMSCIEPSSQDMLSKPRAKDWQEVHAVAKDAEEAWRALANERFALQVEIMQLREKYEKTEGENI